MNFPTSLSLKEPSQKSRTWPEGLISFVVSPGEALIVSTVSQAS